MTILSWFIESTISLMRLIGHWHAVLIPLWQSSSYYFLFQFRFSCLLSSYSRVSHHLLTPTILYSIILNNSYFATSFSRLLLSIPFQNSKLVIFLWWCRIPLRSEWLIRIYFSKFTLIKPSLSWFLFILNFIWS